MIVKFFFYFFLADKLEELNTRITKDPLVFPKDIPISKKCKFLLTGMLEKNQSLRIDTSSDLFDDWFDYYGNNEYKYYKF